MHVLQVPGGQLGDPEAFLRGDFELKTESQLQRHVDHVSVAAQLAIEQLQAHIE